ncbi:MAG: ATP-binding protein [Candidatus Helarchaeota archaeon]|nr:ATP-binding protein [Candidatus Helarchaeota archaeon]
MDAFGEHFGILASADVNSIEVITRNDDIAIGDIFAIPSARGQNRIFLFKCTNYSNIIRRQKDLGDVASTLVVKKEAYVAGLDEEKILKVEGNLLGFVIKDEKTGRYIFKKPRRVPEHFSEVYRLSSRSSEMIEALRTMLTSQLEGELKVGNWLTGEDPIPIEIMIPIAKIPMHVGIWGATGSGKSNLMQDLTKSFIDYNIEAIRKEKMRVSLFTIDPHDEYALGSDTYGISNIVDLIDETNENLRRALFDDFYYLTPIRSAAPERIRRYAREIALGMNEILPIDIYSIIELSGPQVGYISRLAGNHPDDWIQHIGVDPVGFQPNTVNAAERYLNWLRNSSLIRDAESSILIDIILALERGQILIFNSSLMGQLEQFLCVTVIARTLFEIRKAVKSSTNLEVFQRQLPLRNLNQPFIERFGDRLCELYVKPDGQIKSIEELSPIMITIEEAPSLLTPEIMRQSGNIYKAISRQGRKFGLGLCVISQQVSAIHSALLSQLNTQISLALGNSFEIDLAIKSSPRDISEFKSEFKVLNRGEGILSTSYKDLPFVFKARLFDDEFIASKEFYRQLRNVTIPGEITETRRSEFD